MGLVDNLWCDACQQALEMASHILSDWEALAVLRLRHWGRHFLHPGDCWHIRQQGTGLFTTSGVIERFSKGFNKRSEKVEMQGSQRCLPPP